ncbi:MAG: efflux RND transporter permease subunit [Clostridia bacterium]|nr:efflux RND transporter permease subunit [Clostridia bacterium]
MTKWSVTHRGILALLCLVFVLIGTYAFTVMERQENPTFSSPAASVTCVYPGASPEDIEKQVVKPLEDKINEMSNIKTLESYSMDSVGIIKVKLEDMSDSDINKKWEDLKDKVDSAKPNLPDSAEEPKIETDFTSSYGLIIGLSSDEYNNETIYKAAKEVKDLLKDDKDVKIVDIEGSVNQQIEIDLDMTKLQQYGISPSNVASIIAARNTNIPGGNLKLDGTKIPVQISGEYKSIDEIKNTVVGASDKGTPVYLKNLASVQKSDEDADQLVYINGVKGVFVGVKYRDGINQPKAEKRLSALLDNYRENGLYADMNMDIMYDESTYIHNSISDFTKNLVSAIILMLIVIMLVLGIRSAVIVSIQIPLVIFVVLSYMYLTGIPLHQMSIASLIICLSLLVANGIVSNDNINVYLSRGEKIQKACIDGVNEVKIPILTSTLTTIASFLPLAMMQGSAGKFVKSMPILVSVALIASFVASLTVVPAMAYIILRPKNKKIKQTENKQNLKSKIAKKLRIDKIFGSINNLYDRLLLFSLKHPKRLLIIFTLFFVLVISIVPTMKVQLFPPVDRDQYILNITAPDGSTVNETADIAEKVSRVLAKQDSVTKYSCSVGKGYMKYYVTFYPNTQAANKAQFLIDGTRVKAPEVETAVQEAVPDAKTTIKYLEINLPSDYPILIRISGNDTDTLRLLAEKVSDKLQNTEGVCNAENNYGDSDYKLKVNVNDEKASLVGLTNYQIASIVRMAVNGTEISQYRQKNIDDDSLPIVAKIADKDKTTRDILDSIYVTSSATGANVPLTQVANIKTESSQNEIIRRNGVSTITVGINTKDGYNTNTVLSSVKKTLSDYSLPDGYKMEYGGDNENSNDAFSSLKLPSIIAVILIYLILAFQFGNLSQPLIILGTIPLSFIGVFSGLKLMGYPIGFMALLGGISLMGVVVNNGIVLLDYMNIQVKKQENVIDAIVEACKTRLRPIMVGMVTTVISMLPLMLRGGDLWAPLATSIVFGMLVSSVLTMLVTPAGFLLLYKNKRKHYRKLMRMKYKIKKARKKISQ